MPGTKFSTDGGLRNTRIHVSIIYNSCTCTTRYYTLRPSLVYVRIVYSLAIPAPVSVTEGRDKATKPSRIPRAAAATAANELAYGNIDNISALQQAHGGQMPKFVYGDVMRLDRDVDRGQRPD